MKKSLQKEDVILIFTTTFFKYNHEDDKIAKAESSQEIEEQQKNHPRVKINLGSLQRKNSNPVESPSIKTTNISDVPKFSYQFDDDLPDFVKSLLKSDPKFLKICHITLTDSLD